MNIGIKISNNTAATVHTPDNKKLQSFLNLFDSAQHTKDIITNTKINNNTIPTGTSDI